MTNENPTSVQTLNETQINNLPALLDTVLPSSKDGTMPSAGDMDFLSYLEEQAPGFLTVLARILDQFNDTFAVRPQAERVTLVQDFAETEVEVFQSLVFHVYDCYYQADQVRGLIGAQLGSPFPVGHTIPAGDLSSLEAVKSRGKGYRI